MTFNVGDKVRPSEAAVFRDRRKPAYDCMKRSPHTVGTILSIGKGNNTGRYLVRWDTPGAAFSYRPPLYQAESLLEPLYEDT